MTVIQSLGSLATYQPGWWPTASYGALKMYDEYNYDYATLYRQQPNIRTCVDFLARNIAHLGLHVFRRVSATDRQRLREHPLALLIERPLPVIFKTTRYRLIEALMGDLGIYFNAYWLKIQQDGAVGALLRLPPPNVRVKGGLVPTGYELNLAGKTTKITPENIVHFRGYNPENAITGLSPLETLRRVLAEEQAAGDYREYFWRNAARMGGIIERPPLAPEWSPAARERFKAEFEALYSGGVNSGKTAILEEGMEWKPASFNAQESEYLEGRKLTREECARAYHIPLPMVGILDHATFSNIQEQHRNLYQDCLGPWLEMIEQDIMLQLLPDFPDTSGVYVEFNLQEKLQGSFEEQTGSLQSSVGRPWMTADEARARMNLPSLGGDAAELVTPLNVLVGGQASPRDSAPPQKMRNEELGIKKAAGELDPTQPRLRERYREQWTRLLRRTFERQRAAVLSKAPAAPDLAVLWDAARWDRELTADFYRLGYTTAVAFAQYVATELDFELTPEGMLPWLETNSRIAAENINAATLGHVEAALAEEEIGLSLRDVFERALTVRAAQIALGRVTALASFGTQDAARQGGLRRKTWRVNSGNPRPSHAALNGETVGIRETFSNGLRWPGDPRGSADENAGCQCSVVFGR